ncbi:MAG: hypothetical protein JRD49_13320 [Deltaproteobacteria bacterium]|nr:hypothetical protein [Deltaproteobacteria bacterium]
MDRSSKYKPPDSARQAFLFAGVYALGLMVSPDNLALLGRFAGHFGIYTALLMAGAALLYFSYIRSYEDLYTHFSGPADNALDMRAIMGTWLAYYPLIVRTMAAIFITTGLTVSSGFVFNEVFVYWFPNFSFAYILLALLAGLFFLGPATRAKAQSIFVGTAMAGLALLVVASLFKDASQAASPMSASPTIALPWFFVPLLLFMGFDIGVPETGVSPGRAKASLKAIKSAIALFGVLMVLWAIVSAQHVTGERLAATSIAHMIAAREILGQSGRIIMGIVVITGTCAAVNALFESIARMTEAMCRQRMLPGLRYVPRAAVLGVATAATAMMAGGLAGDEALEVYIRAALLLWLGGYGLLQVRLLSIPPAAGTVIPNITKARLLTTAVITFGGVTILALTNGHTMFILKIMATTLGLALFLGTFGKWRDKGGHHAENQH